MKYRRMPIEAESPEQIGYETIRYNLAESSVSDEMLGDGALELRRLVLCYGDHVGRRELRELVAAHGGPGIAADDLLMTAGAAGALFIVATALLEKGDRMVVVRPNYATNIETPRAIGAEVVLHDLRLEDGWRLDPAALEPLVTPGTRLVSVTTPHNPTGTVIDPADLARIAELCAARGARLLVDETYRDLEYTGRRPFAATLGPHVISVASLSKSFGLPGIRLGWLACKDVALLETFLAAKEQIWICNSVVDEEIGRQALVARERTLERVKAHVAAGLAAVTAFAARERRIEWVPPRGGVVCFPRIRAEVSVDLERFHRILLAHHGTLVGPGHWFDMPRRYLRIGFGWPSTADLAAGLERVSRALDEAAPGS